MGEATDHQMTQHELYKEIKKRMSDITNQLGKIEITDNRINCYVNNKKLKNLLKKNNNVLSLNDYSNQCKHYIERLYGTYIPIKYVVQDYNFSDITLNTVGDVIIEFNNCKFNGELQFDNVNKIRFNECSLLATNNIYIDNQDEELIDFVSLYRCIFIDAMGRKTKSYNDFMIKANNIDIKECSLFARNIELKSINTNIFSSFLLSDLDLDLITKKLNIIKATITSDNNLLICSDIISTEHALFEASTLKIENSKLDFNGFSNINVKSIYGLNYNGVTLKRPLYNYIRDITPESFELLRQRAILANALYRVNEKCENDIEEKSNAYTRKLVNKFISDTLGE